MRTTMWLLLAAAAAGLGACKWTEFDDLQDQTWVDSTNKPGGVKSSDYGIAVARGAVSGTGGGRIVVIGAGVATYSELVYDATGSAKFPGTQLDLEMQYGIPNIGQPVLIADPTTDDISLIVGSDNGIAMLTGASGALKLYQLFNQDKPDAATYMLAPTQTKELPMVAVGDSVLGALLPALPMGGAQPICKLGDSATPGFMAQIKALAAVRVAPAPTDDVLAWDAGGKLYKYPGTVFNGCATAAEPLGSVDTTFKPDDGSLILSIDATHVILAGSNADGGFLQEYDAATLTAIGPAAMVPGLRTAALLKVDTQQYVVAGVPTELVNGKSVGQVKLFPIEADGLGTTQVAAYNDAQPDDNQSFGRGVAVMPFNGKQVIVAAANNEIFAYFRANLADGSVLYDETRQGR